ncbi:MAG: KAP family P-loop domain protein [Candidatus Riflebacteria bacterium HGW-Riflebacteria-1]|jgi:predicted KAP-like P-loop ATPase|nr:MAG: KAP family P-loop domain protein [Candidatus Riflebacteria bacterium HGW-Riflebacteria-1]
MWADKESEKDYLNFGEVSQLAVDIIRAKDMLPVSIGIFGNWGAGKSSLLKLVENQLKENANDQIVIRFDAWLYQGFDDAKMALLEVIAVGLAKSIKDNEGLLKKAWNLVGKVNGIRLLGLAAEGAAFVAGIPTGGFLSRTINALGKASDGIQDQKEYEGLADTAGEIHKKAAEITKPEKKKSPLQQINSFRKEYGEILNELGKPLVIIIDNLDRCLPANAINTMEAIRLFLFLNNTAFIIAADEDMIRSSVASYFQGLSQRHQMDYLDKLIQIPIRVPKAGINEIRAYLFMLYAIDHGVSTEKLECLRVGLENALQQTWKEEPIARQDALNFMGEAANKNLAQAYDRADRISPLLATSPMIKGNPRIVKQLLNVVKMRSKIAQRRGIPLDEAMITKLVIFERCAGADATSSLYRLIDSENGKPEIFKELEDNSKKSFSKIAPETWNANEDTKAFIQEWMQLEPKLHELDLRPAVYLSRETMPIGARVTGLSVNGKECLEVLIKTENVSSPSAIKIIKKITAEEQIPIMEGLINHFRQITDWSRQPKGFAGGFLLAQMSPTAAKILESFISGPNLGKTRPPWLAVMLKDEQWAKGAQ